MDPKKVTIEVSPEVARLVANGATVKVVRGSHDITAYLDLPAAIGGVLDLTQASVKESVVREALDVSKGARIDLDASAPSIVTTPTKQGLTYTLCEGSDLNSMVDGDSMLGNGESWKPSITVKGGASGFYTIKVTK